MSGDGMLTAVWGPSMWHYLHTMSFNYPVSPTKDDKIHYKKFILNQWPFYKTMISQPDFQKISIVSPFFFDFVLFKILFAASDDKPKFPPAVRSADEGILQPAACFPVPFTHRSILMHNANYWTS